MAARLSESVAVLAGQLPESRANYATSLGNLGTFLVTEGKLDDGHATLKESLAQLALLKPERTPLLLSLRRNYAMSLRELGRSDEAAERMHKTPPLPRALIGLAEDWAAKCATAVSPAGIGAQH